MSAKGNRTRLAQYALGSAAVMSMAGNTEGAVFHFTPEISASSAEGVIFSFNRSGQIGVNSYVENWDFALDSFIETALEPDKLSIRALSTGGNLLHAGPFEAGTLIGSGGFEPSTGLSTLYNTGGKISIGTWQASQRGYMGLRFDNGGTANYGWAEITVVSHNQATLHAFAYDDSGAPIAAGAVPEPAQVSLFAAGATGVAAYFLRRRRLRSDASTAVSSSSRG